MLASEVRGIIAPVLRGCPQECGIVSITTVDLSTDSSYATVYISALQHPELALHFLQGERKELQHRLGKLEMRKVPQLRFRIDDSILKGARIDALLEEADKRSSEASLIDPQE